MHSTLWLRQFLDGLVEAERTDDVGEFDERAERLGRTAQLWKIEASRWVLPTPNPPSRYRPAPVDGALRPNNPRLPLRIFPTFPTNASAAATAAA